MSAASALTRLQARALSQQETATPLPRQEQRRLRLVVPELPRKRLPFSMLCLTLFVLGLIAVLVTNIFVSHTTYQIEKLSEQRTAISEERDRLAEDISYRESPQNLAKAAEENGMVRDTNPYFLDMRTGKVTKEDAPPVDKKRDEESVPGPRADAREDVRPNLRSKDRLPAVGSAKDSGEEFPTPAQRKAK